MLTRTPLLLSAFRSGTPVLLVWPLIQMVWLADSTGSAPPTPSDMPSAGHGTPALLTVTSLPRFGPNPAGKQTGHSICEGGCRYLVSWLREEENASENRLAIYRYTKLFLANAPLCVACVRVCAMHPYYFMGTLRISASYLSFLAFVLQFFSSFFILFLFCFCFFFMLSLKIICVCVQVESVCPLCRV